MNKMIFVFVVIFTFLSSTLLFAQGKNQGTGKKGASGEKQYIDLEGLDIQGLIDRPQTLYILKRSKVSFYDSIEEVDYVKIIKETTYKEPF